LVNYYINFLYYKLWKVIDPPKPKDENALVYEEVILINNCDENFDNWNMKFYQVAAKIEKVVYFWTHKFFAMPFTHFFGYLQFTNRSQDFYCIWSWDDKETVRFYKEYQGYKQKDLANDKKPFKYKGNLVTEKGFNT
jgi:hypothetical protein